MSVNNALRGSSSRGLSKRALVASVVAGAATTGRAAMVLNPAPNIFELVEEGQGEAQLLQVNLSVIASEESESEELNEINLEISTLNSDANYILTLNSEPGKSSILQPGVILGPRHFVGTLYLTQAVAEGDLIGADTDFSEGQAQINGAVASYFGFTVVPPESVQARGEFSAESEGSGPLYGWVKLDGSAPESVSVNWAYDDSGQPVVVGSTQPIPEASTLGLAVTGLLMAGGAAWRRRRIKRGETGPRREVVAKGRWQVWEAQRAVGSRGGATVTERSPWDWVVVAGEPEAIVGMATLQRAEEFSQSEGWRLEMDMERGWNREPVAEALLDAALARAREVSAGQVMLASGDAHLVELAERRGFRKVARKETHHGPAREGAARLKARYEKALTRDAVTVRPIREARLEAVQRLVAASGLLTAGEVQEGGPGVRLGFDARYSFFVGEAERPAALILGFEHEGRVRLHVRARDAEVKDFPRHGMIALVIAFLAAVAAAGIEEVSFVTRSGAQADFGLLARRWGARPVEFLETLKLGG